MLKVVANVAGTVATLRLDVVIILRLTSEQALVLHVVDGMPQGVLHVGVQALAYAPDQRGLKAVVGTESAIGLEIDVAEIRVRPMAQPWIVIVNIFLAPQVHSVIPHIRELYRHVSRQGVGGTQVPLVAVDIRLDGGETVHGRDGSSALR